MPWFRTWFSIDPQPASISPTINISIVFICGFLLIVAGQAAEHQYDCGNDKLSAMFFNDRIKLAQF